MKVVKLKNDFISMCIEVGSQFLIKNIRPYVDNMLCNLNEKLYCIPMTSVQMVNNT